MRTITAGFAALVAVLGCGKGSEKQEEPNAPCTVMIGGEEYRFEANRVTELGSDADTKASYGVISDIHGNAEKAGQFAQKFREMGVDGIISPGDLGENKAQIKAVLEALAETGLPVFVIPGNHEKRQDYESAVEESTREHSNIIDMARYRIFDGDDADFVSLPGYQVQRFVHPGGYFASPEMIEETGRLRHGLDDAIVLITHGAGRTNGTPGPATLGNGRDVGDANTARMMMGSNIQFAVCGHIHEAGGIAATFEGQNIEPGELAEQFTANFGTLKQWENLNGETYNGTAGILDIEANRAKYEFMVWGQ
ncbi:MAG TPA: hypothetical protein HA362_02530 [Nanoarchaeota archaeon]|nr:hypothetical protein [Nanoarchaeota archaeon]